MGLLSTTGPSSFCMTPRDQSCSVIQHKPSRPHSPILVSTVWFWPFNSAHFHAYCSTPATLLLKASQLSFQSPLIFWSNPAPSVCGLVKFPLQSDQTAPPHYCVTWGRLFDPLWISLIKQKQLKVNAKGPLPPPIPDVLWLVMPVQIQRCVCDH